ncbi:MAG: serine/threonine protein kinase [Myxococcaceae bacterium]|nr:serine/threonine protein kinase [Myxococcaceae bacterium]
MLSPPNELRSGPKRQLGSPSKPAPAGIIAVAEAERPRSNPPRPAAAAPVQPLPVARNEAAKNPWGHEGSGTGGTDSTMKRVHETPKTQLVPPADPADPLIGLKLGEYNVIGKVGSGGMGIVYRGEQPLIGKQVAIKVLRPELASDPRQVQRLVDEARAVNAVNHPGLINIFSFGETPDGAKYFVMDLLEGQSLEEMLHARGKLKAWEAVPILEGALAALDAAHGAGVIHRDLKPSNIFLVDLPDHTHLVKLLDFGLAKMGTARGSTPQTMNVVVGTPEYMAPEQARALEVSPRTDIYAMGIVAYELLTGDVPFSCESAVETLMMQLDVVPKPVGELEPSIPDPLEKLVMRMLAKRAEERPSSAAEVKRELGRIKRQLTQAETQIAQAASVSGAPLRIQPPPPSAPEPRPGAKSVPPGAKRFETTDVMSPVTNLELRPATDRMEIPGARAKKPWLLPALVGLAFVVGLLAVLFAMRRPENGVEPVVVAPPPPRPAKAIEGIAPPEPVADPEPPPRAEPPPAPKRVEAAAPKPKPVVAAPPAVAKVRHTKDDVLKHIDGLLAKTPVDQRHARLALNTLREQLARDEQTADQTWADLAPYDPTRK